MNSALISVELIRIRFPCTGSSKCQSLHFHLMVFVQPTILLQIPFFDNAYLKTMINFLKRLFQLITSSLLLESNVDLVEKYVRIRINRTLKDCTGGGTFQLVFFINKESLTNALLHKQIIDSFLCVAYIKLFICK